MNLWLMLICAVICLEIHIENHLVGHVSLKTVKKNEKLFKAGLNRYQTIPQQVISISPSELVI